MQVRCGTLGYIAPEIKAENCVIGPEIDMWAFGVMLYEMCFAFKPTVLKNYTYGSGPIPYERRALRKVNKQFIPVIEGCLEMDPAKRMSC
jgi:serine/threonine protein kinase